MIYIVNSKEFTQFSGNFFSHSLLGSILLEKKRGRNEISDPSALARTKKRRVEKIASTFHPESIKSANKALLKGKKSAQAVLKLVEDEQMCDGLLKKKKESQMTPRSAVALTINCNLTKSSYDKMRQAAQEVDNGLYPSYKKVYSDSDR